MTPDSPRHFDLGLVMAGAISAGAYSAGVIDFLLQALRAWEAERGKDGEAEEHAVRLRVMAGASAGGMTGGMLLGALARDSASVTEDPGPRSANPLFDAWVNRIDALHLLREDDLKLKDGLPVSLLDSTVLEDIVDDVLKLPQPMPPRPPWLAERFDLLYTVTNLHGVPYSIPFDNGQSHHGLMQHADYLQFGVRPREHVEQINSGGWDGQMRTEETPYIATWESLASAKWMTLLSKTSLATGAFPGALAHRTLAHKLGSPDKNVYSTREWDRYRYWRDTTDDDKKAVLPVPEGATRVYGRDRVRLPNSWKNGVRPAHYEFSCVDGGVMNNEPFELVRQTLARDRERSTVSGEKKHVSGERVSNSWLDSSGYATQQAFLLIDPFPGGEEAPQTYKPPEHLFSTLLQLFGALKNQARFKPDELIDVLSTKTFSRFVIAPSRDVFSSNGTTVERTFLGADAIACGSLGGFGGFVERSLRAHDFFLGRKNCQSFLRKHFVLPENANVFSDAYRKRCADEGWGEQRIVQVNLTKLLPILPLVGDAAQELNQPVYPSVSRERVNEVMAAVERRYEAVTERMLRVLLAASPVARFMARYARNLSQHNAMKWVRTRLEGGLKAHGLYR